MIIRNVEKKDISKIVNVHLASFSNFFLTSLGSKFLKVYYSSYLKIDSSICICAEIDGELIGFAFGTLEPNGFNRKLFIKNFFPFFIVLISIFLKKPASIIRILKNYNKQKSTLLTNFSELFSIAVNPNYKGKGVGKQLLSYYEKIVNKNKKQSIILTTDYFNNENTLNFYFSCGYEVYDIFFAYPQRKMYKLVKYLKE